MPPNLAILVAALPLATLVGSAYRRTNGHFRGAAGADAGRTAEYRATLPTRDVVPGVTHVVIYAMVAAGPEPPTGRRTADAQLTESRSRHVDDPPLSAVRVT